MQGWCVKAVLVFLDSDLFEVQRHAHSFQVLRYVSHELSKSWGLEKCLNEIGLDCILDICFVKIQALS